MQSYAGSQGTLAGWLGRLAGRLGRLAGWLAGWHLNLCVREGV